MAQHHRPIVVMVGPKFASCSRRCKEADTCSESSSASPDTRPSGQGSRRRLCFSNPHYFCLVWVSILFLIVALFGCSKSGPSKDVSSSAFDSAPADVKQLWSDGMGAWKNHRYAEAATNFVSLQAKSSSLSPQQTDALTKAVDEFGQEAFAAANKGDAGATEAVKALRGSSGRRSASGK